MKRSFTKLLANRTALCTLIWPFRIIVEVFKVFFIRFDGGDAADCCCDCCECCDCCGSSKKQDKGSGCLDCL